MNGLSPPRPPRQRSHVMGSAALGASTTAAAFAGRAYLAARRGRPSWQEPHRSSRRAGLLEVAVVGAGLPVLLLHGLVGTALGPLPDDELADATLLIVGLGSIGTEVARLAKALRMRVVAVNRTGHTDSPYVDEARPPRFLPDLLPVARGVVVALPLTDETREMIDAAAINRMHTGACLINVGRGGVVDEPALVGALTQGHLAGAALDVFATEPLPPDSPLWSLPNVHQPPHRRPVGAGERTDRGPVRREPATLPAWGRAPLSRRSRPAPLTGNGPTMHDERGRWPPRQREKGLDHGEQAPGEGPSGL